MENAEYVREQCKVPGGELLLRVDRDVFRPEGTLKSHDSRFLVSSLDSDKVKPCDLQKLVRDHGQVETCFHCVKDRWWDEDRHDLRQSGLDDAFVATANIGLTLLRLLPKTDESLRETTENFHDLPRKILPFSDFTKTNARNSPRRDLSSTSSVAMSNSQVGDSNGDTGNNNASFNI